MNTLDYILDKYQVRDEPSPIKLMCSRMATLPKIFRRRGFKLGAEIGVERGWYSKKLCELIPGLKLYSIDAWQTYENYRDHVTQERLDSFYLETRERLKPFNCQLIKDFSVKAARRFADGSLDFVFIDAAHEYESVRDDIAAWAPKVRKDGIVSGHDYMNLGHTGMDGVITPYGVKKAVNEWVKKNKINHLFVLKKDRCPCWFYVQS